MAHPASQDRAGGASPLSRFAAQPKALIPLREALLAGTLSLRREGEFHLVEICFHERAPAAAVYGWLSGDDGGADGET